MLKVLNINSYYYSSTVHQQIKKYIKGIQYDIYVPLEKGRKQKIDILEDINIKTSFCFDKSDKFNFTKKNNKIFNTALELYKKKDYDIIHAHSLFTNGVVALRLSEEKNIPFIVTVRASDISVFFKKRVLLRKKGIDVLLKASKIIVLSPKSIERLNKYIPSKDKRTILHKIEVVPNGIDDFWHLNVNNKKTTPMNTISLLHVGDISKRKNVLTTVKVVKKLNESTNAKFILNIVGKITDKKIYRKISLFENINYLGVKEKKEMLSIYRDNDLLVIPSKHETFGLVYAEAMSQGLPVIYTSNEGFDGQFDDGLVGFPVKPTDVTDIALNILKILENYEKLSENSIRYFKKFEWELISEKVLELYLDVFTTKR